jgi:hypothetical protein
MDRAAREPPYEVRHGKKRRSGSVLDYVLADAVDGLLTFRQ